jgi:hypothetical protein
VNIVLSGEAAAAEAVLDRVLTFNPNAASPGRCAG